jgi:hypothetical protein
MCDRYARFCLSYALHAALLLASLLAVPTALSAGTIELPTDVSVSLSAEPTVDLHTGDIVSFTVSVTNNGPEPAHPLALGSSPIYDELDVFGGTADCDYRLVLGVVDGTDFFYYFLTWFPVLLEDDPLPVGATVYCYFTLPYTRWAPNEFPVTFSISDRVFTDLDPSNNSATVTLHRARPGAAPTPVPTLSPLALMALAGLLIGMTKLARSKIWLDPSSGLEWTLSASRSMWAKLLKGDDTKTRIH